LETVFFNKYYKTNLQKFSSKPTIYDKIQCKQQSFFISKNFNLKKKSIFEIGPGSGFFLKHLRNVFKCKVYFYDLNENTTKNLIKMNLKKISLKKKIKIDLVVMRHVLEHINDLKKIIKSVRNLLNDNGKLFVEVPDYSTLDTNTDRLNFEHLSQFSFNSLSMLFANNGWKIDSIQRTHNINDPATPHNVIRLLVTPPRNNFNIPKNIFFNFKKKYLKKNLQINQFLNSYFKKNKKNKIALYAASHLSFSLLKETEILKYNVCGMFDSDRRKHNITFAGVKVFSPSLLKKIKPDVILITSIAYEAEIRSNLKSMRVKSKIISLNEISSKLCRCAS
jgi:2-polyprenyl-3-methyl-5-hydroxy-6-metoxy-1,4-benzoquinol methylase